MAKIVTEEAVLKALNELEDAVEKGDALQDEDTEGGFSTEGTPLSNLAGGESTIKSKTSVEKTMSASDMESEDDEDDDESSAGDMKMSKKKSVSKSFQNALAEDDNVRNAVEVSDFLEAMVDQTTTALSDLEKSLHETVLESHEAIAKGLHHESSRRREFETRLAKAVVMIGNQMNEVTNVIKSLAGQPNVPQRRAVLSKSEIAPAPLGAPGNGGGVSGGLSSLSPSVVVERMLMKAQSGMVTYDQAQFDIIAYESNQYNLGAISDSMRKALEADLLK